MSQQLTVRGTDGHIRDVSDSNGYPMQLTGSNVKDVSLLPVNTIVTGAGIPQTVGGFKILRIEVWGTGTFDVQIQGIMSNGSVTPNTIDVTRLKATAVVTDIITAGLYDVDVAGYSSIQANVITISGGNVNVAGKWVA